MVAILYQSFSAFAGNPLVISLSVLAEEGLLEPGDLTRGRRSCAGSIGAVIEFRTSGLWKAFREFKRPSGKTEFEGFASGRSSTRRLRSFNRSGCMMVGGVDKWSRTSGDRDQRSGSVREPPEELRREVLSISLLPSMVWRALCQ
jgi:4-alpha-glucanotransferase